MIFYPQLNPKQSPMMKEDLNDSFLQYPVMSTLSPSYPRGPWHYKDVHLLAVTYQSTPEAVRAVVPRPLQPAEGNRVTLYWWRFTEVTGFGPYSEVAHSVACTFEGKPVSYIFRHSSTANRRRSPAGRSSASPRSTA